jgi:hypothetical protein
MLAALFISIARQRATSRGRTAAVTATVAAVTAAAAALVATVVAPASPGASDVDAPLNLPAAVVDVSALPVSATRHEEIEFDPSDETTAELVIEASEALDDFIELDDSIADRYSRLVKEQGFIPASRHQLDYRDAMAEEVDGITVITIPLRGSEIPEFSKAIFMLSGGQTHVTEMYAEELESGDVSFQMWEDGVQVRDVELISPENQSDGDIQTVKFSWKKLNDCLNKVGINWAVLAIISVACTAACAATAGVGCVGCIGAMAGWTGGTIGTCVALACK